MRTAEQRAFAEAVDDFCGRHAGTREQRDLLSDNGARAHNHELYAACARLGWLGAGLPEAYGGVGGGMTETVIFAERIAYGLAPLGGFVTTMVAVGPYLTFGGDEQRKTVVSGAVNGAVEAISMSEPGAGSDVAAVRCRAEAVAGGYVINGQKTWCSNAQIADHILLVARTSWTVGERHAGLTMFCVPAGTEGLTVRDIPTMGGRDICDLFFTNCFLPAGAVVGTVDRAWPQLMAGLNSERLILAATMLGRAKRTFDDTLAYVTDRRQFGRPIGSFQALRHRLADLATEIACADLLVYDVVAKVDAEPARQLPREASMAKLKATETAKKVAIEGMQMMGGYGYATEFDMESHLRATIVSTVYGGTSEIQRDIIGHSYGL
ncbi:acyl-CoA dehydrogenase family protein [Pseudofrankia asymbiotica]|uniref:Acyl-CoA dehydrogenase n=1 Tax=Pseudofrankia asymbiotica TaxID=1834516 RepID=A0A1V2HZY3_9ACTN|nr:acyl-CoA dehydrogenase family protein [Pseudofrankia asymbiotica]ONH22230.1 acyl-CoA dehydrogenase [Pseudofrankia asymbiotica]